MTENNINEEKAISEKTLTKILTEEVNSNIASEKKLTEVNRSPDEFKEESIQLVINSDGVLETTSEAKNILTALIKEKL